MTRNRGVAVALLVAIAATALAQDAGAPPPTDVAASMAALADADARRRGAAVDALARARPESVAAIVSAAAAHAADESVWTGLKAALLRWDGESAADALSRARESWPAPARSRFEALVHGLRAAKPPEPFPDFGTSPPEVAEKVAAVLARYDGPPHYRSPNPDAAEIAKLGRDAIPALVADLRAPRAGDWGSRRFRSWAAADALGLIAEERDVPLIRRLLEEGCEDAARSLCRERWPAALDALVAAVERDVMDDDVTDSLEAQAGGVRADLAVVGWVERNANTKSLFAAAEYLAKRRCYDAVPALVGALRDSADASSRVSAAKALTELGEKAGIETLLDLFRSPIDAWARQRAGEALNEVVGKSVFKVDEGRPPRVAEGNYDAAAAAFSAWWEANDEALVFDRESRRWRREGDKSAVLPESPPEVAAKVEALLERLRGTRDYSQSVAVTHELVALGRDAVPELLRRLRDTSERNRDDYTMTRAIVDALAKLVDERDVPAVAVLLADGHSAAARCLAKIHSDAARDALLGAFKKGVGGREVAKALQPYASDPTTHAAAIAWLREFGRTDYSAGEVAELVALRGGDDALAALRDVMANGSARHGQAQVAAVAARLGAKEAIEALVVLSESDENGATEAAVTLNGICGRQVFSTNHRGDVGRTGNIDEACVFFRKWWEESKDRLRFDAARGLWTTGDDAPAIDVGKSPPEVSARVAQILAKAESRNGYTAGSADAEALAALGRPAIPALVERIRAGTPWDEHPGNASNAAAEALRELRTDADVELLAGLLREGRLAVAASLAGCRDARAKDALLYVVARGVDDMDVMKALGALPADAATWSAVRESFRGPGARRCVWVADFIEEHATAEAAPLLREVVDRKDLDTVVAVRCAAALARIGDSKGIDALLLLVDGKPSNSGWSTDVRSIAAMRLNSIVGRRIFVESEDDLPGTSYEDAAKAFRTWWAANAKSLRFDAARRVWTTTASNPPASAAVPPELRAKAQAILADARVASSHSWSPTGPPSDPDAVRLVGLGRAIVPFLVETVREGWPWDERNFGDPAIDVSEQALVALASEDDRAMMLELLGEGRLGVARWCEDHPSSASRDVVLGVVRRGFLDAVILRALHPYAGQRPVHEVLAGWAEQYGAFAYGHDLDDAQVLVEILGTPPVGTHAPLLEEVLDRPIPPHTRWRIAAQLAKCGLKDGVAELVTIFEEGKGLTADDTAYVALALGEVAGTKLVEVEGGAPSAAEFGPDRPPPRVIRFHGGPGVVKDRDAAVVRVRAWWKEHGDRLRFDAASGKWATAK